MVSDRCFDYSWDDQDPDQMTDLVSGEYGVSPDIEDHQPNAQSIHHLHPSNLENELSEHQSVLVCNPGNVVRSFNGNPAR